jgi:multidrug efflux system membrane fusion protein
MTIVKTATSIVAIVFVLAGCSKPEQHAARPARPVKAQTVSAVAPQQGGVRYSATIEAFDQVTLSFKTTGYVDEVLRRTGADGRLRAAQPGDRIGKGTVLARVREADYRERVSQGKAKLAEGEAALTKARLDLERAKTLFAADSLTKPDLDAAQANFDAASARIAAAGADIELAVSSLKDCELVAPSTGVILERRVEDGTLAAAGTVGFVLGDVSAVKARFGIPDGMIQSVQPGDRIDVMVEAMAGTTFAGRVTAIAPIADPQSRVFDVEVTIPNADSRLRPGMIGTVTVAPSTARQARADAKALTVPLTAVVRSDAGAGQFAVLVIEQQGAVEVARMRRVELGEVMGNGIAVLKGVNAGDRVVISGATLLLDGDPVQVLP